MGCIFAGGFSTGLYPTNSVEMNKFIMQDSGTNILVCEDDAAVSKIWKAAQEVDSIKKIVQYTGKPTRDGVMSWADFMACGKEESDDEVQERQELKVLGDFGQIFADDS